jgi:hypothetical protein
MSDSDDYGNTSRNLRGCFGMTAAMLVTLSILAALLL